MRSACICIQIGRDAARLTQSLQGYVLIEYSTMSEAQAAVDGANGEQLLEQEINVDFAFVRPPPSKGQSSGGKSGRKAGRQRSRSPGARRREDDDDEDDIE